MISYRIVLFLAGLALASIVGLIVYYAGITGGRSLDFVFTVNGLQDAFANYDAGDIERHRFGTRVLDGLFPILYTVAICAALLRYQLGQKRFVLIALALIGMCVDYTENSYNLRILDGEDVFVTHAVLTWIKFGSLALPLFFALKGIVSETLGRNDR